MVTVCICLKLKQAENRLFLQIKLGRILHILWAFLIKQLFHSAALVGYEMIIANVHSWNIIVLLRLMLDYDNDY